MRFTLYRRESALGRSFAAALLASLALLAATGLASASVGLVYFNLTPGPGPTQITVSWQTETETDTVAFRVKRGTTGNPNTAVTVHTTPALGSTTSGATYSFVDSGLTPGTRYFYWLIRVATSGQETSLANKSVLLQAGGQGYRLLLPVLLHSR